MRNPLIREAETAQGRHIAGDPTTEKFAIRVDLSADGDYVGTYEPNGPAAGNPNVSEQYTASVPDAAALAHMLGIRS